MKRLVLALALTAICAVSFCQNIEYAEINFMPYVHPALQKAFKNSTAKLYLNNNFITTYKMDEIVRCKIYSKGRISFTIVDQSNHINGVVDLSENKKHYVVVGQDYEYDSKETYSNQEIPEDIAKHLESTYGLGYNNVLKFEEDIYNPFGDIPENAFSNTPGQGSGFLISKDGYVITNYHVIDGAKKISVKGINGDYSTSLEASVISFDVVNDIAILKINSSLITFTNPPYSIVSSKSVKQGESVFALGYPITDLMGEEIKVTNGIINSKSGYKGGISQFQFSAAVQPGNSGGPLFNEKGDVIGIVSAKLNPDIAEAAGYAIKSDYLLFFLSQVNNFNYEENTEASNADNLASLVESFSNYVFLIETE